MAKDDFDPLDAVNQVVDTIARGHNVAMGMNASATAISRIRDIFESKKVLRVKLQIAYKAKTGSNVYDYNAPIPEELVDRIVELIVESHKAEIDRAFTETKSILKEIVGD